MINIEEPQLPGTFTTGLTFAKSNTAPIPLTFLERPHTGRQAATRGRTVLKPDIDLGRYSFRAVIDWLNVEVEVCQPTQFRYLQGELEAFFPRRCDVRAIEPDAGGVSTRFIITIQEPKSAAHVHRSLEALAGAYRLVGKPFLRGIEVSIDAKPRVPSDPHRAKMLGVMNRTIFTRLNAIESSSSRPRHCAAQGQKPRFLLPAFKLAEKTIDTWLLTEKITPAPVDATFYLGAQHDPVLIKVMDKVIDQQNRKAGTCKNLTDAEKRVRIEVTLKGRELKMLGLHHLEDLQDFSFTSLQGSYFQFKLPTFEASAAKPGSALSAARSWLDDQRRRRFLTTGVMGLEFMRHAREAFRIRHRSELKRHIRRTGGKMVRNRRGTGASGTLVAYEEMNRLVSNALGGLDKREQTAWRSVARDSAGAAARHGRQEEQS
jgi:hypothetical protein